MEPVRVGLVGCGNISAIYFRNGALFNSIDIVACADLAPELAVASAEQYSIPKACPVEALLADPGIELVLNLTIPKAHAPVGIAALEAGKSVYTEKPLAVTRDEGKRMVALAREKGVLLGAAPDTFLGAGLQTCRKLIDDGRSRERRTSLADVPTMRTPDGAPTLVLAGSGDYSLAPLYARYPGEFLEQWKKAAPDVPLRFATFGDYVDAVKPGIASGAITMPTVTGGWNFTYFGFWIQNPTVKQRYRRAEHALQASEMLATLASLRHETAYPAQDLYHAWLLMLLNMDRNTLWGGAGGMVFEHPDSWDVKDRFDWVDAACARICGESIGTIRGDGDAVTLFNPANWRRPDPVVLPPDCASGLGETPCQTLPSWEFLCLPDLPATGWVSFGPGNAPPSPSTPVALPEAI